MTENGELHVVFGTGAVGLAVMDELVSKSKRVQMVNRSGRGRGCRVLGSSAHCPRAKIFGPAKPLPLRVAIASPSNKPWSCHNARACG
jgi:hypothetical protein